MIIVRPSDTTPRRQASLNAALYTPAIIIQLISALNQQFARRSDRKGITLITI